LEELERIAAVGEEDEVDEHVELAEVVEDEVVAEMEEDKQAAKDGTSAEEEACNVEVAYVVEDDVDSGSEHAAHGECDVDAHSQTEEGP
jgi:hypothetical protein